MVRVAASSRADNALRKAKARNRAANSKALVRLAGNKPRPQRRLLLRQRRARA